MVFLVLVYPVRSFVVTVGINDGAGATYEAEILTTL